MNPQENLYCSLSEVMHIHEERNLGTIVLDPQERVVLVSALAERLLTRGGLRILGNQLLPEDRCQRHELRQLVSGNGAGNAPILLRRPQHGGWLVLSTSLARTWNPRERRFGEYRVLMLRDPTGFLGHEAESLSAIFGLTRRESELACHLAVGHPISEFAEEHHVSINTVKSHLKQVFRKLGVHNQIQLVACVLSVLY